MKVLSPRAHAPLDYLLVVLFLIAPGMFNFTETAAYLSYAIAGAYLVFSLLTDYPLGAIKLIPFPVHGWIEFVASLAYLISPWIFGFAADSAARNFFLFTGVVLLVVWALTDYKATQTAASYRNVKGSRPASAG